MVNETLLTEQLTSVPTARIKVEHNPNQALSLHSSEMLWVSTEVFDHFF
jgi:hypothetical protein